MAHESQCPCKLSCWGAVDPSWPRGVPRVVEAVSPLPSKAFPLFAATLHEQSLDLPARPGGL
eukprot:9855802-Alexandrium_andersonii.AAC.1